MDDSQLIIDSSLARHLVDTQFPQWRDLSIRPVASSGWDNRTFHLGDHMLVRMPSSKEYASQVEKEHKWLPRLAPFLPLSIPEPLAMGAADCTYPWKWSIYRWIEGDSAASTPINNLSDFAQNLAKFLVALQSINGEEGPLPGPHSFYRGGSLSVYDIGTRQAIEALKGKIDEEVALDLWQAALSTSWQAAPVWVHGDLSTGNLLLQKGKLSSVIDFGQLTVGDPSCDLAIAWTLFEGESREVFRSHFQHDKGTWARGRAWTLWKALIVAAGFTKANNVEARQCWRIIEQVLEDHRIWHIG